MAKKKGLEVHEFLLIGAENAQSGRELCQMLHISKRELTAEIEKERRMGYPICAITDPKRAGYFLAGSKEEMQTYCNSLQHRHRELKKTLDACSASISDLP